MRILGLENDLELVKWQTEKVEQPFSNLYR